MDFDDRYARALKQARRIREFYIHAMTYAGIISALFALNMLTSPSTLWFVFPALGWGIGLGAHAVSVFGQHQLFGREWEERKARELMEAEDRRRYSESHG